VNRIVSRLSVVSVAALIAGTAQANPGQKLNEDLATGSAKWGISIVRAVVQSQPEARYIPPPDVQVAADAIKAVVDEHHRQKARVQGNITLLEGAANATADLAAAVTVAATGGAGAVPVMMVRAAVQAGTDDYFGTSRENAQESMRAFLVKNQNRIQQDAGVS
jgi:hypothetical protein